MQKIRSKSEDSPKTETQENILSKRFQGSTERLEVWYDTFTDDTNNAGFWIHHELISPTDGDPYVHGWIGYFFNAPDNDLKTTADERFDGKNKKLDNAVGYERFGPLPISRSPFFECGDVMVAPNVRKGKTENITWELTTSEFNDRPVFTFGKLAWEKEILPSCQIVGGPNLNYNGIIKIGSQSFKISNAKGALSRIYGHGNAKRWGWLHVDLGDSDMLEVVSAVSTKPGLEKLKPLGFLQLRYKNQDWPSNPLVSFPFFKTKLPGRQSDNHWSISGKSGKYRINVSISLPQNRCVSVDYTDPDGHKAVCVNTEIGDADIYLEQKISNRWILIRHWDVKNSAHCEMGFR